MWKQIGNIIYEIMLMVTSRCYAVIYGNEVMGLLIRRASITEIGYTGYVSALDEGIIAKEGLKPLTRFERWMLFPYIQHERMCRRAGFRQACIDVLGEDPETDWM